MALHPAQPSAPFVPWPGQAPDDAELVRRALAGDRWAEQAIFQRHVGYLRGVCLRLLRDPEEVQDVLQDTFVDVLEQLHRLRTPDQLRHWMTGIAVHKVHRRFRRRRLLRMLGLEQGSDAAFESLPARADLSPELRAELTRLDTVLARIDARARACWVLRHVEGYQLEEVASLCSCSLATAKRRIAQAEQQVRKHVGRAEVES